VTACPADRDRLATVVLAVAENGTDENHALARRVIESFDGNACSLNADRMENVAHARLEKDFGFARRGDGCGPVVLRARPPRHIGGLRGFQVRPQQPAYVSILPAARRYVSGTEK